MTDRAAVRAAFIEIARTELIATDDADEALGMLDAAFAATPVNSDASVEAAYREALGRIAHLALDMPAAYNDEVSWYRARAYDAIAIAARALR